MPGDTCSLSGSTLLVYLGFVVKLSYSIGYNSDHGGSNGIQENEKEERQGQEVTKRGRKSGCTAAVIKKTKEALEAGMTNQATADMLGINQATFYSWIKKAESGVGDANMVKFAKTVKEARAVNCRVMLDVVTAAAMSGHWSAAAWILERRHNFRKDVPIDVAPDNTDAVVDLSTPEGKKQIVKALKALPVDLLKEALAEVA